MGGALACMFLRRESHTFNEIEQCRGIKPESFAGVADVLAIRVFEIRILGDLSLGGAFQIGEAKNVHAETDEGYPDELCLGEELDRRQSVPKDCLQHEDVGPTLMIRDHQIPLVFRHAFLAFPFNPHFRGSEDSEQPAIEAGPAEQPYFHEPSEVHTSTPRNQQRNDGHRKQGRAHQDGDDDDDHEGGDAAQQQHDGRRINRVEREYTGPFMTRQMTFAPLLMMTLMAVLSGCSTLGYYGQAAIGQTRIVLAREPLNEVLVDPDTPVVLRSRLQTAQDILTFAERTLGLRPEGQYSTFVETGREAVVFNVVAADEFSLVPMTWCYPIVGCLPYRGFFKAEKAHALAATLRAQGADVHVGGVPAYSTLGWFSDPLLDTFIAWPDGHLANLLIHELTHGRIWVKGDAVFNESLASFVGHQGALAWLDGRDAERTRYLNDEDAEARFGVFLLQLRNALQAVYSGALDRAAKRLERTRTYDRFRVCYRRHRSILGGGRYDKVIDSRLNNAYLAARRTYDHHRSAFAVFFARGSGDWGAFFEAVEHVATLPASKREAELRRLAAAANDVQTVAGAEDQNDFEVAAGLQSHRQCQ